MKIQTAPISSSRLLQRPPTPPPAPKPDLFVPTGDALKGAGCGALAGVGLQLLGRAGLSEVLFCAGAGLFGGAILGYLTHKPEVTTAPPQPPEAVKPPEPAQPLADFLHSEQDAASLLSLRADANRHYLDAETRYANMQASAAVMEGPKDELKDLARSWNSLPARLDPSKLELPADPKPDAQALRELQRSLLTVRSQGQALFDEAGTLRGGLYIANGPRAVSQQLINDSRAELARVESLLERMPHTPA